MNNIKKGIIHNAKGDLAPIGNLTVNDFALEPNDAEASVTFFPDGRYQRLNYGPGGSPIYFWGQWVEVPYTGDLDGTPTPYTPDPTWIGASNYTMSWGFPGTTAPTQPDSYGPQTSGSNAGMNQTFIATTTSPGNNSVNWGVTLTNIATGATYGLIITLNVDVEF